MTIDEALLRHTEHLMSVPGVVGVAVGDRAGRPVVLVMVDRPVREVQRQGLPTHLEGFPVELDHVGEISAL